MQKRYYIYLEFNKELLESVNSNDLPDFEKIERGLRGFP